MKKLAKKNVVLNAVEAFQKCTCTKCNCLYWDMNDNTRNNATTNYTNYHNNK